MGRTNPARMTMVRMILPRIASTLKYSNPRGQGYVLLLPWGNGRGRTRDRDQGSRDNPRGDATAKMDDVLHSGKEGFLRGDWRGDVYVPGAGKNKKGRSVQLQFQPQP